MNATTTFAVEYTTFVWNGQHFTKGVRRTKWFASEAEIPAKYSSCIGRTYNDEQPAERWGGQLVVRTITE